MRRAEFSVGYAYIIGGIIAGLIITAYFTGVLPWILDKVGLVELIPVLGLNGSVQGNGVVGVNLASGNLEYFTGDTFKEFSGQEFALLGGYEFNIKDVQGEIYDFYFKTQRRPDNFFNIRVNNWRYWTLSLYSLKDILVKVETHTIPGYRGPISEYKYGLLNGYSDGLKYSYFPYEPKDIIVKDGYLSSFIELDSKYPGNHINEAFEWIDSILQGNKCEKFLTLNVKQKDVQKDLIYTVRKSDGYLVIDLTKPIPNGIIEKWNNPKCFERESYFDFIQTTPKIYDNGAKVEFYYTTIDGYDLIGQDVDEKLAYSFEKGWTYQQSWRIDKGEEESINRAPEIYRQLSGKNLYDGLILLTKKEGIFSQKEVAFNYDKRTDQGVFVNKVPVTINLNRRKWDGLSSEKDETLISEFIYDLLDKYNSFAIVSGGEPNV